MIAVIENENLIHKESGTFFIDRIDIDGATFEKVVKVPDSIWEAPQVVLAERVNGGFLKPIWTNTNGFVVNPRTIKRVWLVLKIIAKLIKNRKKIKEIYTLFRYNSK